MDLRDASASKKPSLSPTQSSWNQVKIIIQRNQCGVIYTFNYKSLKSMSKVIAFFIIMDPPTIIVHKSHFYAQS